MEPIAPTVTSDPSWRSHFHFTCISPLGSRISTLDSELQDQLGQQRRSWHQAFDEDVFVESMGTSAVGS
jgi:hypothetical protein